MNSRLHNGEMFDPIHSFLKYSSISNLESTRRYSRETTGNNHHIPRYDSEHTIYSDQSSLNQIVQKPSLSHSHTSPLTESTKSQKPILTEPAIFSNNNSLHTKTATSKLKNNAYNQNNTFCNSQTSHPNTTISPSINTTNTCYITHKDIKEQQYLSAKALFLGKVKKADCLGCSHKDCESGIHSTSVLDGSLERELALHDELERNLLIQEPDLESVNQNSTGFEIRDQGHVSGTNSIASSSIRNISLKKSSSSTLSTPSSTHTLSSPSSSNSSTSSTPTQLSQETHTYNVTILPSSRTNSSATNNSYKNNNSNHNFSSTSNSHSQSNVKNPKNSNIKIKRTKQKSENNLNRSAFKSGVELGIEIGKKQGLERSNGIYQHQLIRKLNKKSPKLQRQATPLNLLNRRRNFVSKSFKSKELKISSSTKLQIEAKNRTTSLDYNKLNVRPSSLKQNSELANYHLLKRERECKINNERRLKKSRDQLRSSRSCNNWNNSNLPLKFQYNPSTNNSVKSIKPGLDKPATANSVKSNNLSRLSLSRVNSIADIINEDINTDLKDVSSELEQLVKIKNKKERDKFIRKSLKRKQLNSLGNNFNSNLSHSSWLVV